MEKKNNIPIYRKDMALELIQRGFTCVDEKPNYKQEGKIVFFFNNEDGIYEAISEISNTLGRSIMKVYDLKVAQKLLDLGYELIDINTTGKTARVFKWTPTIHEDSKKIKEELYGKKRFYSNKEFFNTK